MTPIVHSVTYRNGQSLGEIAIDEISDLIKQPDIFVWLGLHEPDEALLLRIRGEFGLHELAIEDAHHAHQRPKIETYSGSLFIVLKPAQLEAAKVVYGETHLFVGPNSLVSVRQGASSSYAHMLQRCEAGTKDLHKGPGSPCMPCSTSWPTTTSPSWRNWRRTLRPSRPTSSWTASTDW